MIKHGDILNLYCKVKEFKDTTGYLIPTVENLAKLLHCSAALTSILGVKKLAGALN